MTLEKPATYPRNANGYATFALHPITADGKCTCDGKDPKCKPGKHPKVRWADLQEGEKRHRDGEPHGIATGHRSKFFEVDLDVKPGIDGIKEWERLGGGPTTYTVVTPSGSIHLRFKLPANGRPVKSSAGQIGPGIDIRGEGGMIVAPGTPHPLGGIYEVTQEGEPVDAPDWLLARAELYRDSIKEPSPQATASNPPIDIESEKGKRHIKEYANYLATDAKLSISGQGGRNVFFGVAATGVRRYRLPLTVVQDLIKEHYNPRLIEAKTDPGEGVELTDKINSAYNTSEMEWGLLFDFNLDELLLPVEKTPRKVHSPEHKYTYQVSFVPRDIKPVKISFPGLVSHLMQAHEWEGVISYDLFKQRHHIVDPPLRLDAEERGNFSQEDVSAINCWLSFFGTKTTLQNTEKAFRLIAKENSFHPVREYLASLPVHEGCDTPLLDAFARRVFGVDDTQFELVKKFLVSAVRRILWPGYKADCALVLTGKQGSKKSTLCQALFGNEWTQETLPTDLGSEKAMEALRGYWCVEMGEMSHLTKNELSVAKGFITKQVDAYRPAYAHEVMEFPRQCVFIGTTNSVDFLRDPTGERRYWVIAPTKEIDIPWLEANKGGIWSEALMLAKDKAFLSYLTPEQNAVLDGDRDQYKENDEWEGEILAYCDDKDWVTIKDIWIEVICGNDMKELKNLTRAQEKRISNVLIAKGFTKGRLPRDKSELRPHGWKSPKLI